MSSLREYLTEKREALRRRRALAEASGAGPSLLQATVRAEGRSGVRRIRIRDFQILSDSAADYAGYDLGPGSPELQLGVLGACLTHVFLIQAADRGVPLDSLEVDVSGLMDRRAGWAGHDDVPRHPYGISYRVRVASPASRAEIDALHEAVERACPVLNLLKNPQRITGAVEHVGAAAPTAARA
ncbi:MAG TPA: OsmC family protein [Methylomirabilota bacterium]|nr:OsmC family protein [Methylomirabilota bacterium]